TRSFADLREALDVDPGCDRNATARRPACDSLHIFVSWMPSQLREPLQPLGAGLATRSRHRGPRARPKPRPFPLVRSHRRADAELRQWLRSTLANRAADSVWPASTRLA